MVEQCEESYGFLPCSDSLGGSLSLMFMYGYLLLIGANQLSDGSELLLEILDPGVIGGLLLPVLGALPDTLIVIFSGMGSREEAQEQVAVGVGTLAGSTMMLLTIATGGSILLGRCDLSASGTSIDKTLTKGWSFTHTGITTDRATLQNALIMVISTLLYLTVQVPTLRGLPHDPPAALAGSVICIIMLAVYSAYQMIVPELQRRRMERARKKRLYRLRAAHALQRLDHSAFGNLFDPRGNFDTQIVDKMFDTFDTDHNGTIDSDELRAFLTGLAVLADDPTRVQEDVDYWMREFDRNESGTISKSEFREELEKWMRAKMTRESVEAEITEVIISQPGPHTPEHEVQLVDVKDGDDEEESSLAVPLTPKQIATKAILQLLLGTCICALFSDPMVGAVSSFSKASGIPAFFVGFVVTPFASNSSELVSSLKFAAKKRTKNISLTFSQVYGAVTMNNTLVLGVFLLVVWYQDLSWTYTSEVAIIVGTTLFVGVLGMTRLTWQSWMAFLLFALYPLSVVLVYVFDFILKWDG